MGYWKVDATYQHRSDCSQAETLELRFDSKPIITFAGNQNCGCRTYNFSVNSTNLGIISNSNAWYHSIGSPVYVPGPGEGGEERYDCINGSCVSAELYGSPGIYESLPACEQNCGPGCGGVCISNADWAKISNLAAMIRNKDCS